MSDPLDLFPGVAPPLLATLSAPAVLRAGACCRRWRDVTRRVAGRRTAEGAGPAAVALLVRTEECEGRSEVACALAALTRNLQWAPEVALIFATEDAACYSDGNGVRTLEADARARLPRACLVACGRAPGVFGPVAGALQEVVDAGGCAMQRRSLVRPTRSLEKFPGPIRGLVFSLAIPRVLCSALRKVLRLPHREIWVCHKRKNWFATQSVFGLPPKFFTI